MDEVLSRISDLIKKSDNIPEDIKPIVIAICRGYIRETKGKISIEGIINVCDTQFTKIDENNKDFYAEEKCLADTETDYDKDGNVYHKMRYIDMTDYIKLISILTHELGHVITELKTFEVNELGVYRYLKRTTDFYFGCKYENGELLANAKYGFRMTDGFLESLCTKIFSSPEFRSELLEAGYDIKDYIYKDERLFPSRVYDEYKACFELFDYIMDGILSDFSCRKFTSMEELRDYIEKNKLNAIFSYLDKSNNALWDLKPYEGKEADDKFNELFEIFIEEKDTSLNLAKVVCELYGKNENDETFQKLYQIYENTLLKQKQLPIPSSYLKNREQHTI